MQRSGPWADDTFIQAIAWFLRVDLHIVYAGSRTGGRTITTMLGDFAPNAQGERPVLFYAYLVNSHYQSLLPVEEICATPQCLTQPAIINFPANEPNTPVTSTSVQVFQTGPTTFQVCDGDGSNQGDLQKPLSSASFLHCPVLESPEERKQREWREGNIQRCRKRRERLKREAEEEQEELKRLEARNQELRAKVRVLEEAVTWQKNMFREVFRNKGDLASYKG